jgi:8-oxo-dGTP diphosphatase
VARRHPEHPVVAVGVLLLDGDRVLLVRRARPPQVGRWTVPGGGVELGETLEAAAQRELAEETGLTCALGPVVEVLDRVVRDGEGRIEFHYVILDFLGSEPRGELRAGSDAGEARWFRVDELAGIETTDGLVPVVQRAREMREGGERGPHRESET